MTGSCFHCQALSGEISIFNTLNLRLLTYIHVLLFFLYKDNLYLVLVTSKRNNDGVLFSLSSFKNGEILSFNTKNLRLLTFIYVLRFFFHKIIYIWF